MKRHQVHGWRSLVAYNKQKVPSKVTEGQTFLKAAGLKRLRLLRMMVDGGVDVNVRDVKGQTALMSVIMSSANDDGGHTSSRQTIVEYLLRKGADPNIQDFNGQTALMHACLQSAIDIGVVQLLIMYKANPLIKDLFNRDALSVISKKQCDVKDLLLESCSDTESNKELLRNYEDERLLNHSNSLESESQDMYTYLVVPDNAKRRLSQPLLTLPSQKETKWSPKLNRKKPFYCVEELDMQFDNDGETEGVILRCPNLTKSSSMTNKRNSLNDNLPKVKLSNENGETRLLFDLPSNKLQLQRMSSLFDWERQLSLEESNKQNQYTNVGTTKDDSVPSCDNMECNGCSKDQHYETRNENSSRKQTRIFSTALNSYNRQCHKATAVVGKMQTRTHSAPSVMSASHSFDIHTAHITPKHWGSAGNMQAV